MGGENFILDIGSGHRPHPDATHLCDLYLINIQRGGKLIIDRPFVNCSVEYLPFRKGTFKFVYARHLLEHTNNPRLALIEMTQVAKKGYIECPTYLAEHTYGWAYHNWSIFFRKGKLCYTIKPQPQKIIDMHKAYQINILVKILHHSLDLLFGCMYTRVLWSNVGELKFFSLTSKDRMQLLLTGALTELKHNFLF